MSERSDDRFKAATTECLSPGEYIAVNIDGVAHCVGLYITNACQTIWYDSDGNFDYDCALTSIDIEEGSWKVFRVTLPSEIIPEDILHLLTNLSGKKDRITSVNKIPSEACGRENTRHARQKKAVVKKDQ